MHVLATKEDIFGKFRKRENLAYNVIFQMSTNYSFHVNTPTIVFSSKVKVGMASEGDKSLAFSPPS